MTVEFGLEVEAGFASADPEESGWDESGGSEGNGDSDLIDAGLLPDGSGVVAISIVRGEP